MSSKQAQPGDTVELKDKDGGFYDDETNFKIVRNQKATLGSTIGTRTTQALLSGGLLIVESRAAAQEPNVLVKIEKVVPTGTALISDEQSKVAVKSQE